MLGVLGEGHDLQAPEATESSIANSQVALAPETRARDSSTPRSNRPALIKGLSKCSVVQISCGASHALCLSADRKLFAWGHNQLGQLGLGDTEDRGTPTEIPTLRARVVEEICCGAGHSFAIDSYGSAYSWGASAHFQTGHFDNSRDILVPRRLEIAYAVTAVACGIKHTLLLTSKKEVISFGSNAYG